MDASIHTDLLLHTLDGKMMSPSDFFILKNMFFFFSFYILI